METITKFKGKTDIIINGAANGRSLEELLSETLPLEPVSGLILSRLGELSLDDLAIEVGISHSAIYKIREGKIRPQRDVLLAMACVKNDCGGNTAISEKWTPRPADRM